MSRECYSTNLLPKRGTEILSSDGDVSLLISYWLYQFANLYGVIIALICGRLKIFPAVWSPGCSIAVEKRVHGGSRPPSG